MKYLLLCCCFFSAIAQASAAIEKDTADATAVPENIFYYPREIVHWNVKKGTSRKSTLFIRQADKHPIKIKRVKTSNEYIHAKISRSGGKEYKTYSIDIDLSKNAPVGSVEGMVSILTDHPLTPELNIPIFWNVLDDMEVDPPAFGVRLTRGTRNAGGVIKIASLTQEKFTIKKIDVLFPGVTTDIKPMKECCGYYIAVLVSDPEFKIRKSEQSSFVIHTTHKKQKMIVVPLMVTAPTISAPESPVKK